MFSNLIINTYLIVCQILNQTKKSFEVGSAVFKIQAFKILPTLSSTLLHQNVFCFFEGNSQATKLVEVSNPPYLRK